jgi:predicted DNA binding CopG/RHH family protein
MKKEYDLKRLKERPGRAKVDASAAKVAISLRLDGALLAALKTEAERLGLPYQTHISSVLHQYMGGELIETKTVELLKKLKTG